MKIYNTLSRKKEIFAPIVSGKVSIYVCGATVQASPHIGHLRSAIIFDMVRRWFEYNNFEVIFIRNVTDIDDKIIDVSKTRQMSWWNLAFQNEIEFNKIFADLNILTPSYEPRATAFIPQMIIFIEELIKKNFAYASGGDVYFDVEKLEDYGVLSGQKISAVNQGESLGKYKKNEHDFTLWKKAKPGEPYWNSPFGPGRPGWHIECTVMATNLLGEQFDIHGGGRDLLFPHHENELAQARGLNKKFANFWMHNGMLNLSGEKMSKSKGNVLTIKDLTSKFSTNTIRYYFLSADYRTNLDFSFESISKSAISFSRIKTFVQLNKMKLSNDIFVDLPQDFIDAMNDDFSTSEAISIIHILENEILKKVKEDSGYDFSHELSQIVEMFKVLGIDILRIENTSLIEIINQIMPYAINKRNELKLNKNWDEADKIRDLLKNSGIELIDKTNNKTDFIIKDKN